jgi:hypothetical protein
MNGTGTEEELGRKTRFPFPTDPERSSNEHQDTLASWPQEPGESPVRQLRKQDRGSSLSIDDGHSDACRLAMKCFAALASEFDIQI